MSLSVVITGRDDDYEGDFLDRLHRSVSVNCSRLTMLDIDYEYIIVEWSPKRNYLINHPQFLNLFKWHPRLREVIIHRSVVEAEKLSPNTFYEYFAKNKGIRAAKYPSILLTNSDIILTHELAHEIKKLLTQGLDPDKFYRPMYRSKMNPSDQVILETTCLHNPSWSDSHLCGAYSGDFLLARTQSVIEKGQGYDEINPNHRTEKSQTNMDGEILSNMYHAGMRLSFIEKAYIHIEHSKNAVYDGGIFDHKYNNKPDWGFIKYRHNHVDSQLQVIRPW